MAIEPTWVNDVLGFWFTELEKTQWFEKDDAVDAAIKQRFTAVHREVSALDLETLMSSPRTALAAVIVLDQFSRNMSRGTPASFASDAKALDLANQILQRGLERSFSEDEKAFCYLPLEHSEVLDDQQRCVALFRALGNDNYLSYAKAHLAVIERFGRFPHRNAILGRVSTPEELEFLAQPGSGF
ncbi:MAG: DUF924 family protein [Pseudomonadota bacterium]